MAMLGFLFDIVLLIDFIFFLWLTKFQFLKTIEIQLNEEKKYGRNSVLSVFLLLFTTFWGTICLSIILFPELNFYILKIIGAV
jgi:hypothetical protein